jgi:rubrerythrin
VSAAAVVIETRWKKTRCPSCGVRAERPESFSPAEVAVWCEICKGHKNHDLVVDSTCPICIASKWRALLRAVPILVFQILHPNGDPE